MCESEGRVEKGGCKKWKIGVKTLTPIKCVAFVIDNATVSNKY